MTALVDLYGFNGNHEELVHHIVRAYGVILNESAAIANEHRVRRETIARRRRLYRDQSDADIARIIDQIYETPDYRNTLKKYIVAAKEQNVYRRIVDEIASLYDSPVVRTLEDRDEQFHAEEKRLRLHELWQSTHRMLTLCNDVLVWRYAGAVGGFRLRVITPDLFDAIPHPVDMLTPAAFLIDYPPAMVMRGALNTDNLPHFEIWDDTYRYQISKLGRMVDSMGNPVSTPIVHGAPRIPGVLLHRREPTECLLDASHGADIESCHLGVALINVMIMRLSKSQGERQPILQGNLAAMAAGQVANGERPLLLPPEVVAMMLDTKTTPEHYLAVKRDKITSTAQTYGMSYEQFSNTETADSGKLYELRREKLKEIRSESRRRAVVNEAAVVELMGYSPEGMRLDFQEQAAPLDPMEKLELLREKMKMGLASPLDFMMSEDQDLDRKTAAARMKRNLVDYAALVEMVRALNMPADADASNPGKSPQENGADNQPADDGGEPDYPAIAQEIINAA